jgi:hypothetical protein
MLHSHGKVKLVDIRLYLYVLQKHKVMRYLYMFLVVPSS